jgi:two-component system nitrate/nitrite response regulator NarL
MEQIFVTRDGRARPRWQAAFAPCIAVPQVRDALRVSHSPAPLLWLDTGGLDAVERDARLLEAIAAGTRVVLMSPTPSEREAFACLKRGAAGYCHVEAAPEQLRQIKVVVEHGGMWLPPELVQRVMRLSVRLLAAPVPHKPVLETLTAREAMVAEQVAQGASNHEIAGALAISERTVKAHLSSIFGKLEVRDRVQLALLLNNIPTVMSVS